MGEARTATKEAVCVNLRVLEFAMLDAYDAPPHWSCMMCKDKEYGFRVLRPDEVVYRESKVLRIIKMLKVMKGENHPNEIVLVAIGAKPDLKVGEAPKKRGQTFAKDGLAYRSSGRHV